MQLPNNVPTSKQRLLIYNWTFCYPSSFSKPTLFPIGGSTGGGLYYFWSLIFRWFWTLILVFFKNKTLIFDFDYHAVLWSWPISENCSCFCVQMFLWSLILTHSLFSDLKTNQHLSSVHYLWSDHLAPDTKICIC